MFVLIIMKVEIVDSLEGLPRELYPVLWRKYWSCHILFLGHGGNNTGEQEALEPLSLALLNLLICWVDELALKRRLMAWRLILIKLLSFFNHIIITVSFKWLGGKIGIGLSLVTRFLRSCFHPSLIVCIVFESIKHRFMFFESKVQKCLETKIEVPLPVLPCVFIYTHKTF